MTLCPTDPHTATALNPTDPSPADPSPAGPTHTGPVSDGPTDRAPNHDTDHAERIPLDGGITVRPWTDPVIDQLGHDPRSAYVEEFWLGILGPSTTWLLRRIAAGFDLSPDGFTLPVVDTARALGLGAPNGRHSPFVRSISRGCTFRMARWEGDQLCVRRKCPPLSLNQVRRLPESLQAAHLAWQREQLSRHHPDIAALKKPTVAVTP